MLPKSVSFIISKSKSVDTTKPGICKKKIQVCVSDFLEQNTDQLLA